MTGRKRKRELENESNRRREIDSDYIWKWICRFVVLVLIFYWLLKGVDPSERWIGLVALLLGINEFVSFKSSKDKDEQSFSVTLRKGKGTEPTNDERSPSSNPVFVDWSTWYPYHSF